MATFKLDEEFLQGLVALRAQVREIFQDLRIPGVDGDISGSGRLERVPALRKRDFNQHLTGQHGERKQRIAARRLLDFLRGAEPLPVSARRGLRSEIEGELSQLRQSGPWTKAAATLEKALAPLDSPDRLPDQALNAVESSGTPAQPTASGPIDGPNLLDAPTGRSTGFRRNWIDDLCHAEAEWRSTNLGEDEERWLQLLVRFRHSYTRARGRGQSVELPVQIHRIHVDATLDGGRAASRDPWVETAGGGDSVEIFQGNAWTPERPCFEVDNPVRASPLNGQFDWFDLCEVSGVVGEKASLEITASIGGISVPLPEEIRGQLDPNPQHDYDKPELHLIEGWLRHRMVPRSRLKGGGLYQLTQIDLWKRQP